MAFDDFRQATERDTTLLVGAMDNLIAKSLRPKAEAAFAEEETRFNELVNAI